jgi:hypothetical protein
MTAEYKVLEVNCTTGETIERPFTEAELAQLEIDVENDRIRREEQEAELNRITALKESAKAKLIAGEPLTPEEAATIVL